MIVIAIVKRTRYFLPVLAMLVGQQLFGHGGSLLRSVNAGEPVLYTDWLVVIFAPLILLAYGYDVLRET